MTLTRLCLGLLCAELTSGCHPLAALIASHDERGVPLQHFAADAGRYFPGFIREFFPGAATFERDYPSFGAASSGIKLIEVKPLTEGGVASNESNLSWSVDGVFLGYEVIEKNERRILVKDLAGNYSRQLAVVPEHRGDFLAGMVLPLGHSYNAALRWSYDSTRYAFMSNGGVGRYHIYIGAVGEPERVIAKSPTKDGYASWNPGRNELIFVSARTGRGDIYLIELDSQKLVQLSRGDAVDIFPEWFPDGNAVVYSSGDAFNHDLHIVERAPNGGWQPARPLTSGPADELRPVVSPDGRYIAFYANSDPQLTADTWNLHILPYTPGTVFQSGDLAASLVASKVLIDLNTGPAWSPDSRKVFYVAHAPDSFNPIHAYELATGERYVLATGTRMNRDLMMSRLGILSFRAQTGAWDRVYLALTNQGAQLQGLAAADPHQTTPSFFTKGRL